MRLRHTMIAIAVAFAALNAAAAGRIIILNDDKPGVGFNDPTPAAPVGNNPGTTLGQQRLNVFLAAAERWQNLIDVKVDVHVSANFGQILDDEEKPCDATGGILGHAKPTYWTHSFDGAPQQNVWYPIALANQLAGKDLQAGASDIYTKFNSDLDNATCLGESKWYYGMDRNHGSDVDLYVVVLHEIAHGLGVSNFGAAPAFQSNRPSVFDTHVLDLKLGMRWSQMTREQREISMTNIGNLVWDGQHVHGAVRRYLTPPPILTITSPAPIARDYEIGTASFGPKADRAAMGGRIVQAVDAAADGSASDACSALTNPAAIAGNVAVADRGNCTFAAKARNARAAGALGVIVVDNKDDCSAPAMGLPPGDPDDVTIPVISLTRQDGEPIKAQLAQNVTVTGILRVDPSQLAGASPEGYARLYAPCTFRRGSSTVHWDSVANPNLLMEPTINSDLLHGVDLTVYMLNDIGWAQPPRTGRHVLRR